MKQFCSLLIALCCCVGFTQAQERYLDEVFTEVNVQRDVVYGTNISVLSGQPEQVDLLMDVYQPAGDDATNRPVVIYWHTGSFLPPLFNGQITGARSDSAVVEICSQLARRGYVAIAATYRQGWNPAATGAEGQNIRTGTLLNAVYRGIQDVRTSIRFLRKTVAEDGNPFGVDAENIALFGQGTGGYLTFASAYLDRVDEITSKDKFINTETLESYVDTAQSGDPYGLNDRPLNIANHVEYSSDFKMAVNAGGALGDISWIEGREDEPVTVGFHVLRDPFAPFFQGAVIVPTTGDFVVNVAGTRQVVDSANFKGNNAIIAEANNDMNDPLNALIEAYSQTPVTIGTDTFTLAVNNMFPFVTDSLASGPYEWWSLEQLRQIVAGTNAALGTDFDADELHESGLITNPDMSKQKALTYIDTIMDYWMPRAFLALNLATSTQDIIQAEEVELTISPNPVSDRIFVTSGANYPMKDVALYNLEGRLQRAKLRVDNNTVTMRRGDLPPGIYVLQVRFEEGMVSKKLVLR